MHRRGFLAGWKAVGTAGKGRSHRDISELTKASARHAGSATPNTCWLTPDPDEGILWNPLVWRKRNRLALVPEHPIAPGSAR